MKALREIALALALILPMADSAAADAFMSGRKLHERCRSPDVVGQAMCLGYALGVVDGNASVLRCAPRPVEVLEIVDAVKLHLERYPSDRDFPGQLIVRLAIGEAWPCGK
ncbi:MAG: Rap1a/Tai family immunity protein [Alphaproteobacteria bacterium]|nr:Rap1a/Tai family immunity protein [Alphaproteobacteria bacterium]